MTDNKALFRRSSRRLIIAVVAAALLVGSVLTGVLAPVQPAKAANAALFNPGLIMSDQVFYNKAAMTAAQAQSFIAARGASCVNNGSVPCLKNLKVNSPAEASNSQCGAISARSGINAGTVFALVGEACGVNPEVLITLVEKEQGLVSASSPQTRMYDEAAGFACPDTAPCSETFSGFFNQIYSAAKQFEIYRQFPTDFNYRAGQVNNIQYNPNAACGTEAVFIQNQATAGLYDYTPYVPNKAALANLNGVGDSCSSYGNRNFWRIFSDWFGNPTGGLLSCTTFDGCVTGWNFSGAIDRASYSGSAAHSGTGYMALVPHTSGAGINQIVRRSVTVGDLYQGSFWVKAAVPGQTVRGSVVVWGIGGGGNENESQNFSVGSTWTQVTVNFQAAQRSHTEVALQLYLFSPNLHYDIDDASLSQLPSQPAKTTVPLQSPSFESGDAAWPSGTGVVNRVVYSGAAEAGSHFFATNTKVAGSSFVQEVSWPVSSATSYTARIWLRSATGQPYRGSFVLWALGSSNTNAATNFTVGKTWTQVQVTLPVRSSGQSRFAIEVYEDTLAPQTLYVDNASISTNQITDGSVELGAAGWSPNESGTNLQVYAANSSQTAMDGIHFGATNVAASGGSIATSVVRQFQSGQTFTATMWIRADNTGATFTGRLVLWELGPDGNSAAVTNVSVGNQWQEFTVTRTIQNSSATSLKLQLYEDAVGVTALFDGATLN